MYLRARAGSAICAGAIDLSQAIGRRKRNGDPRDAEHRCEERRRRLESLLDELAIKHLRHQKAYQLSGGERRRLEITRALVTEPKFLLLDEPFAGVDPIAVHDIQTIVAGLRHRGIGVLITDHNVEQTLDIVDRAYIMFEGRVQVAGRSGSWSSTTASRSSTSVPRSRRGCALACRPCRYEDRPASARVAAARPADQSAPVPGDGSVYMPLLDLEQHLKQELLGNPSRDDRAGGRSSGHGGRATEQQA